MIYLRNLLYVFVGLGITSLNAMEPLKTLEGNKYQTMENNTYTIDVFKQLVELKKKHSAEIINFLTNIDKRLIDNETELYGEIEESARYHLLNPQFQEGGAYKPFFNFVVQPNFGVMVATDIVALKQCEDGLKAVVLRKLKGPKDNRILGYATIGGISEHGITFEENARKESKEEANITLESPLVLIGAYSDPMRDHRKSEVTLGKTTFTVQRHIATVAFGALTKDQPAVISNTEGIKNIELLSLTEIRNIPAELWLAPDMPDMYERAFKKVPEALSDK